MSKLAKWTKPVLESKRRNHVFKKKTIKKVIIKMCERCGQNQTHNFSKCCLDCIVEKLNGK